MLLILSGLVFCGINDLRVPVLLGIVGATSFVFGSLIHRRNATGKPIGVLLAGSVILVVAPLLLFKYWDFLGSTLRTVGGLELPRLLSEAAPPVAISFFTFNALSYLADVSAGRVTAAARPIEYAGYLSFFPQLISGPLTRFKEVSAQLARVGCELASQRASTGITMFVLGLSKKLLVADTLGRQIAPVLQDPAALSFLSAWAAAIGFAMQVYFDFGGYSDMAVGLGLLMGVKLPRNFDSPYKAIGVRDFWRRWHMSLSSWLRDYLFLPLTYSILRRTGDFRLFGLREEYWAYSGAAVVTMGIAGLWHGPSWTFVLWGLYFGLLMAIEQVLSLRLRRVPSAVRRTVTFVLVVVGWVLFRSGDLGVAGSWFSAMLGLQVGAGQTPLSLVALVVLCLIAVNTLPEVCDLQTPRKRVWAFALGLLFFVCLLHMNRGDSTFIYYQF
ncbi:MAG: MBOAT family O-acyltransferase [Thermoanaerobaculaceae bacterium]